MWDYNKWSNIYVTGVHSEIEEKEGRAKNVFKEVMDEIFLNMLKVRQEVVQSPNPKKLTLTQ